MKGFHNINGIRVFMYLGILLAVLLTVLVLMGCRRDLWVYQDNFKQVELDIDWRNYFRDQQLYPNEQDPDGMTVWFFPKDGSASFHYTTAEVRHYETYASQGDYEVLVIDYSPLEYSHQEFLDMDFANTAKVQTIPSSYQPDSLSELYGPVCYAHPLPSVEPTGLYTVSWEPENIASDTIHMHIDTGKYDQYIPYKERDSYQQTLVHQLYRMEPLIIPWRMRVRVYIKGIYYLYQAKGSIAGLADGYYLMQDRTSDTPCLLALDDWETVVTGDNVGYIAMTFMTWGVQDTSVRYQGRHMEQGEKAEDVTDNLINHPADEIRLNLRLLLRDRRTVCNYHFDVGNMVREYWNEYALRIDLMDGFEGQPDLPYVDAYNGMGFDGVVVPWEDGANADVQF